PAGAGGTYRAVVRGSSLYALSVSGATGTPAIDLTGAFTVPARPAYSGDDAPTELVLALSEAVRIDLISTATVTLDRGTVTGFEAIAGRPIRFLIDVPHDEGTVTYTVAPGALTGLNGRTNAEAITGSFAIDNTGPRILALPDGQVPAGDVDGQVQRVVL